MSALHDELVAKLQYFEGHSDTLGLFAEGGFLRLATPAELAPVEAVAAAGELRPA